MAQYPDPYRPQLQATLEAQQAIKAKNVSTISILESENLILDEMIQIGQDTLDEINAGLFLSAPTNFAVDISTPEETTITWDDDADGRTYVIERDEEYNGGDFPNPTEVYSGPHTASVVDSPLTSGLGLYYRIKSTKAGKDDSEYEFEHITVG